MHSTFKEILTELVLKSINPNNEQVLPEIARFIKEW